MDSRAVGEETTAMSQLMLSLPVGLWLFSLGADVMFRSGRGPASWDDVAFFTMFGGLVVALLTAVPGFVDQLAGRVPQLEPRGRLRLNLGIVALYVVNLCLRACTADAVLPIGMSVVGVTLLAASGWLGGELVHARPAAGPLMLREVRIETRRRRTARTA
jgi:uncharacterized membrane protein